MSTTPTRVFAARLAGLPVFDPRGDQVGKVRDVHPLMWVVAVLFVIYFAIGPITSWLT